VLEAPLNSNHPTSHSYDWILLKAPNREFSFLGLHWHLNSDEFVRVIEIIRLTSLSYTTVVYTYMTALICWFSLGFFV